MEASTNNNNHGPWPYVYGWTIQDVGHFIRDIGFPEYVTCFTNNAVNGEQLACLNVYDLQRFGVPRMEHAMVIHAYIQKAVRAKLFSFQNPDQPPRESYLSCQQCTHTCPTPCPLPPVNKPLPLQMTFDDFCLPKRDEGSRYNRCHYYPGTSFHKQCSVLLRKTTRPHGNCPRRTCVPLPCCFQDPCCRDCLQ